MLTKINKTYTGLVLALTLAVASAVYAQFTLISGGTGYGYGYGYGVGYGSDLGTSSYRIDGGSADQYLYGYGYVPTPVVSGGGGGGSTSSGYGGGVYTNPNATVTTTTTGATTTTVVTTNGSCMPYFVQYMRIYRKNDLAEVKKLQAFLNEYEGEKLPVTGRFITMTDAAVKRFQKKYGITPRSGYVYVKTTDKLNELYCQKVANK